MSPNASQGYKGKAAPEVAQDLADAVISPE
jgi:hypothetical protein